jgi:tRNA pseudouridine55 synthase
MDDRTPLDGVLVIDKPPKVTSFDVVAMVRRHFRLRSVGHTGTLDPMATGVLALCLGNATRIAQFMLDGVKSYQACLKLGVSTNTLDADGDVTVTRAVPPLNLTRIEQVLASFRGEQLQTPPMFSAKKVGGKRLYELARAGEEIPRTPVKVTVQQLTLVDFTADTIAFSVTASKGFFVRVLAESLGEALGCGAHLTALRRTQSGACTLEQATPLDRVLAIDSRSAVRLVSLNAALQHLPSITVNAAEAMRVKQGGMVKSEAPPALYRIVSSDGTLLAVAEVEQQRLKYRRVLC